MAEATDVIDMRRERERRLRGEIDRLRRLERLRITRAGGGAASGERRACFVELPDRDWVSFSSLKRRFGKDKGHRTTFET